MYNMEHSKNKNYFGKVLRKENSIHIRKLTKDEYK